MSMSMSEYVDMWGASENISVQAVRDVVTDLLDFYDHFPDITTPAITTWSWHEDNNFDVYICKEKIKQW